MPQKKKNRSRKSSKALCKAEPIKTETQTFDTQAVDVSQYDVQQILLEGGYYRAQITSLSAFDLIAGGLAWGIRNSRFNIDVCFEEEANIGQKIRVSENICFALKEEMHCPYDLRPHQIQGLDWPRLYTVSQWLLKCVAVARSEYAVILEQFIHKDTQRRFGCCLEDSSLSPNALCVQSRRYRHNNRMPNRTHLSTQPLESEAACSPTEHANRVLLEYGYNLAHTAESGTLSAPDPAAAAMDDEQRRLIEEERRDLAAIERLSKTMALFQEHKKNLRSSTVSTILHSHGAHERVEAQNRMFQQRMRELEEAQESLVTKRQRCEELTAVLQGARQHFAALQEEVSGAEEEHALLEKSVERLQRRITSETEKMDRQWEELRMDDAGRQLCDNFSKLLAQRDRQKEKLLLEEEEWKRVEQDWNLRILDLQTQVDEKMKRQEEERLTAEEGAQPEDALEHQSAYEKYLRLREAVQQTASDLSALHRRLDRFETEGEMQEYERRRDELTAEVNWKYLETQLSYARYNLLTEKLSHIQKETEILESIWDSFEEVADPGSHLITSSLITKKREMYLSNLTAVTTAIAEAVEKAQRRLRADKEQCEELREKCAQLQAQQRRYYILLEQLEEAMTQYDVCMAPSPN